MKPPQDLTVQLNEEVALNCSAKGYPPPTTNWLKLSKDGNQLVCFKGSKLSAVMNLPLGKTKLHDHGTNFVRFNFTKEDAGLYKCHSSNSIGSVEKTIALNYFGKLLSLLDG